MKWGKEKSFTQEDLSISVEAMPAIHGVKKITAKIAGGVNGYWLNIKKKGEQYSIYVTSDTVTDKKVLKAIKNKKADLMIPNMGYAFGNTRFGAVTLGANMAEQLTNNVSASMVIPVHFNAFTHYIEAN